jgi:N-formylglutamate amidohydrolase
MTQDHGADAPELIALLRAKDPVPGLIYAAPHAGRIYPADMRSARRPIELRRMEDALVDELVGAAPDLGVDLLVLHAARTYLDVNREPSEFDETMFSGPLKPVGLVSRRTTRVEQGLGLIPREAEGRPIYARKLDPSEAVHRLETIFHPYHRTLKGLVEERRARDGQVLLIDWHSMPSAAARVGLKAGLKGPDVVLGDRFGAACDGAVVDHVEAWFRAQGLKAVRNRPFAGGFVTETFGKPARGVHALQIELNRALYLDETTVERSAGFGRLRDMLSAFTRDLAAALGSGLGAAAE